MTGWLLDVNCLIALADPMHVHHERIHTWFETRTPKAFGTCPIAENGLVRVLSQPAYPGGRRTPEESIRFLEGMKSNHRKVFKMLSDDLSITDSSVFVREYLIGSKQVTDAYLLAVAFVHKWKLVSFDHSLPWQAIRGATSSLVEVPAELVGVH